MSFSFCVLGSGSKGNCTVLLLEEENHTTCAFIDCGLSPRATRAALIPLGLTLDDVSAIMLTHLDGDHFHQGWIRVLERQRKTVHVHKRHRNTALRRGVDGRCLSLFENAFTLADSIEVEPVLMAHDELGTVAYILQHADHRLGFATDLGHVPDYFFDHFVQLDALAIESNYDRDMQLASNRPPFLKRRIMNGSGHLSNEQSLEAVLRVAEQSPLSQVALLHLSQQCNHPRQIKTLYSEHAPELLDRLTITHQRHATPLLPVRAGELPTVTTTRPGQQHSLFGG